MNRREFCLSLGTVFAGGIAACSAIRETPAGAVPRKPAATDTFRAKKFFSEQWRDHYALLPEAERDRSLKKSLAWIADDCDALIVTSIAGMTPGFLRLLETESSQAGLDVYFPADFPVGMPTPPEIRPLRCTRQNGECVSDENGTYDGFRLLFSASNGESAKSGIVLCDRSLCLWQTFLCRRPSRQSEPRPTSRNINLQTARWLDAAENNRRK